MGWSGASKEMRCGGLWWSATGSAVWGEWGGVGRACGREGVVWCGVWCVVWFVVVWS